MQFVKNAKIVPLVTLAAGAAAQTAINSSVIDFSGYEGALIILSIGPITTGGAQSVKVQGGATSSPTTDLEGTSQTIVDTEDNTVRYIDIRRPLLRYARIVISRATQDSTFSAVAVLYGSRDNPVTQAAGVTGETFVSPAAGTA